MRKKKKKKKKKKKNETAFPRTPRRAAIAQKMPVKREESPATRVRRDCQKAHWPGPTAHGRSRVLPRASLPESSDAVCSVNAPRRPCHAKHAACVRPGRSPRLPHSKRSRGWGPTENGNQRRSRRGIHIVRSAAIVIPDRQRITPGVRMHFVVLPTVRVL